MLKVFMELEPNTNKISINKDLKTYKSISIFIIIKDTQSIFETPSYTFSCRINTFSI